MTCLLCFIAGLLVGAFVGVLLAAVCMIGSCVDAHIEKIKGEWDGCDVQFVGDESRHKIVSTTATKLKYYEIEKESE